MRSLDVSSTEWKHHIFVVYHALNSIPAWPAIQCVEHMNIIYWCINILFFWISIPNQVSFNLCIFRWWCIKKHCKTCNNLLFKVSAQANTTDQHLTASFGLNDILFYSFYFLTAVPILNGTHAACSSLGLTVWWTAYFWLADNTVYYFSFHKSLQRTGCFSSIYTVQQ